MNKNTTLLRRKLFVLILAVFIGVGCWFYYRSSQVVAPETEIILLPELKWGSYRQITQAIQDLPRKLQWRLERPGQEAGVFSPAGDGLGEERGQAVLRLELAQREALLAEELQLRRRLLTMKIDRLVHQKRNQDEYLIKQALEEKRQEQAAELADFRRQKEKEYSSKLATLHFKMAMPDLSPEAKSSLAAEVAALQAELRAEVQQKEASLAAALADYAVAQQEASARELERYRRRLEAESEQEYQREKKELEAEFWAWVRENDGVERFLAENLE
ncbi:MAG TPA: hypothetical protein GXX33_05975 [Firmicutes bacterium]|uniref:Uncharacterized protein n=1 Tax=Capillibacterium thermochitinicola TaxID=2699427 RepID=A0A8J6LHP8_9FIRM|nr:hypothetical protein [Capillibacterium thermochitinicola]MBA2132455.1 hypothetical protein [Capillibacterium thermochitinicola]HHW12532.1 hypothetical protein [Bacillota bacterium]